jgi:hypothetical protein
MVYRHERKGSLLMWDSRALLVTLLRALPTLVLSVALGLGPAAGAQESAKALACAVEGARELKPAKVCEQLGQALGRPVKLIDDARKATQGDSLQILRDDVRWTVVLLQNGSVRSWTRVSVADARGREASYFARAARGLLRAAPKPAETCVRLVPGSENSSRSSDLVYPWAELKPCVRRVVDVVDPWWTSPANAH